MFFTGNKNKSLTFELRGDKHRGKNYRKAFDCYKKALEFDGTRVELYDKLIALLDEREGDWSEEDFALSLAWTMKKQELEDPTFKRLNARAEPEFKEVTALIKAMMAATGREDETARVEAIVARGHHALYPLIDFLLTFKEAGRKAAKLKKSAESPDSSP